MTEEDILKDAEIILKDLEETGDPFCGTDWSLVQILRDYINLKKNVIPGLKCDSELYERGYNMIGACDISNYLALCQEAGERNDREYLEEIRKCQNS